MPGVWLTWPPPQNWIYQVRVHLQPHRKSNIRFSTPAQIFLCHFYPFVAVLILLFVNSLLDCKPEVAMAMLRWVYTDELELTEDDAFLIDLMKLANRFQLQVLRERSVDVVKVEPLLSVTERRLLNSCVSAAVTGVKRV